VIIGNIFHTCKETKNAKTLENKGFSVIFNGDPGGIRTPDPRLRSFVIYIGTVIFLDILAFFVINLTAFVKCF